MRRKVLPSLILTLVTLASGATSAELTEESRFVADCKLYLHGREVKPLESDGHWGYLITRTETEVTVNGTVYASLPQWESMFSEPDTNAIDPYKEAREWIQLNVVPLDDESVLMLGNTVSYRETVDVFLEESRADVRIVFDKGLCHVIHEGLAVKSSFPIVPHHNESKRDGGQLFLRDRFSSMSIFLRPGILMIAGHGYLRAFPLSHEDAVLESLRKISTVSDSAVDGKGPAVCEPLTIDGYRWGRTVVRDFLTEAKRAR